MRISDWSSDVCSSDLPERAHPVHQAEVDRLGSAALVGGHVLELEAEHFRGGGAVDVGTRRERRQQAGVLGQVSHDPQLDLRVVAREQLAPRRRDEGLADAAAVLAARSDEHTSELQSLMSISYAVFTLKKKMKKNGNTL